MTLGLSFETISLQVYVMPFIEFFLFSLVTTFTTANIMLANNTCDIENFIIINSCYAISILAAMF